MQLHKFQLGAEFPLYQGDIEARQDPVTGDYLVPAFATDVALIEEKAGHQRFFKEGQWHYVIDKIGTQYWLADGSQHTIESLGKDLPTDALLEAPVLEDEPTPTKSQKVLGQLKKIVSRKTV
ncbi:hypothetical protein DFP76_101177 [Marinomonas aquiplantarum]|uniref:Uncharacterized protein n=2 Tax=Marinomonas aquiplantarum TaxID=491951 RepID=A0A366D766_9GAMM|nr:hypothetical protein DFP76_101177 [Marinomonas aquiplantarum]